MFETPEQFRERIRGHLKGSFAKKAEENGIKTLSEVDPQGQPQPGQTAGGQADKGGQQQSIQAPPQQANFKKTIQTAFENLSAAFKSKGQLPSGTKLKNSGSVAQKAINDMYVAVNNQKLDNKTLSNTFKKSIGTVLDAIVKDVESLSKTNQQKSQQDQQSGGSDQQPQQMNAEAVPGENLQLADENYGDGVVNSVSQAPVVEKNDPISVDSMQGILKFATPDQIGDAIKKMKPEDFQQFTNGLQKTALDVIARSVNGAGAAPAAPSNKNNNPNNDGGVNQEGNLKLGEL